MAYSKYGTKTDFKDPLRPGDDYTLNSNIQYGSLKYAVSYFPTVRQRINTGFQAIGYQIMPGEIQPLELSSGVLPEKMRSEQSVEMALFADDDFDLTQKLALNVGLRFNNFVNYGPGVAYSYLKGYPRSVATIADSTLPGTGAAYSP